MNSDRSAYGGDGPTIFAPIPYLERFVRDIVPNCRIPPIWNAQDPLEMLQREAGDARLAISYGGFHFSEPMIEALPSLEFVQVIGAGYDGLDISALKRRGIPFATGGDLNCGDVADYAVGMAIALRRRLLDGDRWVRSGDWIARDRPALQRSFSADRAGIVGLGSIGRAIARRLSGFDIPVTWWGPREKPAERLPRAETLLALAQQSSVLFVCCPLDDRSHHLISAEILDALGPEGLLVTVARGRVTDEDALIGALREGRVAGAGLDVFWQEPTSPERWADVPNVLLSPHQAGVSIETDFGSREVVRENIRRFFADEEPLFLVGS